MKLSEVDPSRIFVFKEKHGYHYFLADTPERIQDFCFDLLKQRHEDESWDTPEANIEAEPIGEEPKCPKDKIESLPTVELQELYRAEWAVWDMQFRAREGRIAFWKKVRQCLDTQDKKLAVNLIFELRDAEYERFEIEYLENLLNRPIA